MKILALLFTFCFASVSFAQTQRVTNLIAANDVKGLTFTSSAAAPAGSGVIRLGNGELIAWEASPAGTDVTLTVNSSEQFVFSAAILSPTFITPVLGTPSSGNGSNITNVNAATLGGATFAAPGAIGGTTPAAIAGTTGTFSSAATAASFTATGSDAGRLNLPEGPATALIANTFSIYAPTDVAAGGLAYVVPAAAASGVMRAANSSGVMTITHDAGVSNLAASTSADLRGVLSDENGTGAALFSGASAAAFTSPDVTTSITTPSTTFALANTNATTVNAFGAATTVNTGAAATQIWNFGGSTTASQFRFLEPSGSGTNYSGFKAVAQAANIDYSLPPAVGAAGSVLTDAAGNGVLTWGVGGAALTSTYVGYGASSVLSGEAAFVYTAASNILTVGGVSLGAGSEVSQIGPLMDIGGVVPLNNVLAAYGVGTAYPFTNTAAAIDFGTTDPVKVLAQAGTYLIFAQVHLTYTNATVVAETATVKVRRTNNTAADLSAVVVIDLPASTTLTNSYGIVTIPPFSYTTAVGDDSITIFANVSAALSVGTIDATAIGTSIVALRQY